MADQIGLLSLPDEILAMVALKTRKDRWWPFRDWAKAATTCKHLWELQLPFCRILDVTWNGEAF